MHRRKKPITASAAVYAAKGIIPSSVTECSKMDYSVLNNGTMCNAAFCQNLLTTCFVFAPELQSAAVVDLARKLCYNE